MESFDDFKEGCLGKLRLLRDRIDADMKAIEKAETTEEVARIALEGLQYPGKFKMW